MSFGEIFWVSLVCPKAGNCSFILKLYFLIILIVELMVLY